jgi:amino acid transporter
VLVCWGALSGALAWISAPSHALLVTAHDVVLPLMMQKTHKQGVTKNILLIQALIVTAVSSIYLVTTNVSAAFFLISAVVEAAPGASEPDNDAVPTSAGIR